MKDEDKVINYMDLVPLKKQMVVQSNTIIDGIYKVTLDEARLLNLAISKIKKHDSPERSVKITHAEFTEVWGVKDKNLKGRLSDIGDELIQRTIDTISVDPNTGKKKKTRRTWISKIEYDMDDSDQYLEITFSPDVAKFIYQLEGNFTMIEMRNLSKFTSPYTFRIYSWIYKYKHLVSNIKDGVHFTDKISVDDFKEMLGISNSYAEYKYLKSGVIEKSLKEINSFSDLSIILEEYRVGRSVKFIQFIFVNEQGDSNKFMSEKIKPTRKRLPSRPKAKSNSHLEGEWAKNCIYIIEMYEKDIKEYDNKMLLPISDLEKLISYYEILGNKIKVKSLKQELTERRAK
ncbi:plasmid replication protein [Yersinia aldovae]|uniref:replication initiation protein n=1 Tax=Yersinia aldovae TaxID=29483 RepID=UPI0005E8ACEC|nr:replication initiation protein [Yersinia aldovae]CNK25982.1 plasmid replication protein [Yersinia aldovae]